MKPGVTAEGARVEGAARALPGQVADGGDPVAADAEVGAPRRRAGAVEQLPALELEVKHPAPPRSRGCPRPRRRQREAAPPRTRRRPAAPTAAGLRAHPARERDRRHAGVAPRRAEVGVAGRLEPARGGAEGGGREERVVAQRDRRHLLTEAPPAHLRGEQVGGAELPPLMQRLTDLRRILVGEAREVRRVVRRGLRPHHDLTRSWIPAKEAGRTTSLTCAPAAASRRATSSRCAAVSGCARSTRARSTPMRGAGAARATRGPQASSRHACRERSRGRPGEDLQRERRVLDRATEDAHVVSAPRQRHHAHRADPAVGALEAHHAAESSRTEHRADRLRAERERGHARGHRRRRARGRAAGGVPRRSMDCRWGSGP